MKPIITLTTDFGLKDYYLGALKGQIYKSFNNYCEIVDISHSISPFNIYHASFVLKHAYRYFPENTIHIIDVDSEESTNQPLVIVEYKNHFFLCADNGILSLIVEGEKPSNIYQIDTNKIPKEIKEDSFVFIAKELVNRDFLKYTTFQKKLKDVVHFSTIMNTEKNILHGHIIHIDRYGNGISNIMREDINRFKPYNSLSIHVKGYTFNTIYEKYSDLHEPLNTLTEADGEKLAVYGSNNHINIAIMKSNLDTVGGASTLLGIDFRTPVTIRFKK